MIESERTYSIEQAADLKAVSPGYIRKAIKSNGLPDSKGIVVPPLAAKLVGRSYQDQRPTRDPLARTPEKASPACRLTARYAS